MRCLYCHMKMDEELNIMTLFKARHPLCDSCKKALLEKFEGPRCQRCHQVTKKTIAVCGDCQTLIEVYPAVDKIYTFTDYNDAVKMLMHRYKFLKDYAMVEIIGFICDMNLSSYDYVVPIPISKERMRERTYNQALEMIVKLKAKPAIFLETKAKERQSEQGRQSRMARKNPFYLSEDVREKDFTGKSIIIIDDIYTTGVTVHQAADVLKVLNFQNIDVLTFSKA